MSVELGRLVRAAMQEKGLSQGKVAVLVGVFDSDRYLDATQVRLITTGERRPTRGLVERLIDVLDLDPPTAWQAAGLLPPEITAEELRTLMARPSEPALAHAVGGSDTPPALSLRKTPTHKGRRRGNSCCPRRPALQRRLLGPAHLGQPVAAREVSRDARGGYS